MDTPAPASADPLATLRDDLPVPLLALDEARIRALQRHLVRHALLDPGEDSFLGPVTLWALQAFCSITGLKFENTLTLEAAERLRAPEPVLPLQPGDDFAGRIVRAMQRRGDWLCRHPDCLNIVYAEGTEPDGRPSPRRTNAFDDTRVLLRIDPHGRPVIARAWHATTGSGRAAIEEPADEWGPPQLEPGQYKAWVMGRTALDTPLEQDGLIQAVPLPVRRDANLDYHRDGDPRQFGNFIIDQHGAQDAPRDDVGETSAGCLVGREQAGHAEFLALLRTDPRWRVNNAYMFMTTLLTAEQVAAA